MKITKILTQTHRFIQILNLYPFIVSLSFHLTPKTDSEKVNTCQRTTFHCNKNQFSPCKFILCLCESPRDVLAKEKENP